jgi:hypothetical protein
MLKQAMKTPNKTFNDSKKLKNKPRSLLSKNCSFEETTNQETPKT